MTARALHHFSAFTAISIWGGGAVCAQGGLLRGIAYLGSHCTETWSSTQWSITLSSGEAELVALVKMSAEVIGILQLGKDWGMEMQGRV